MMDWAEFFKYLHDVSDNANKKAEEVALINPNEYAVWEGVRSASKLLLRSLSKVQHCLPCIESKITYFKTYYKGIQNKIDSSMTLIEGYNKITVKSAYNIIVEIESKFKELKENYEESKMSFMQGENSTTTEEVQ